MSYDKLATEVCNNVAEALLKARREAMEPCERCKGTKTVTLFDVDLGGGFYGDADEQPCPECAK